LNTCTPLLSFSRKGEIKERGKEEREGEIKGEEREGMKVEVKEEGQRER